MLAQHRQVRQQRAVLFVAHAVDQALPFEFLLCPSFALVLDDFLQWRAPGVEGAGLGARLQACRLLLEGPQGMHSAGAGPGAAVLRPKPQPPPPSRQHTCPQALPLPRRAESLDCRPSETHHVCIGVARHLQAPQNPTRDDGHFLLEGQVGVQALLHLQAAKSHTCVGVGDTLRRRRSAAWASTAALGTRYAAVAVRRRPQRPLSGVAWSGSRPPRPLASHKARCRDRPRAARRRPESAHVGTRGAEEGAAGCVGVPCAPAPCCSLRGRRWSAAPST